MVKPTSSYLKFTLLCYWRYVRGCPIIALEYFYGFADVLAVSENGMVIETEVKVSIADLKRDKEKPKHRSFSRGSSRHCHYFYFAVPAAIAEEAKEVCHELYPYAGLLSVGTWEPKTYERAPVFTILAAKRFPAEKFTNVEIMRLARGMSNTLCNMGVKLMAQQVNKPRGAV